MDNNIPLPLSVIKNKIHQKESVAGLIFTNDHGATGTILAELSPHGKRQAQMTCTFQQCIAIHLREQSDWHQSHRCPSHTKQRTNSTNDSPEQTEQRRIYLHRTVEEQRQHLQAQLLAMKNYRDILEARLSKN